jgi:hypothetical protein
MHKMVTLFLPMRVFRFLRRHEMRAAGKVVAARNQHPRIRDEQRAPSGTRGACGKADKRGGKRWKTDEMFPAEPQRLPEEGSEAGRRSARRV